MRALTVRAISLMPEDTPEQLVLGDDVERRKKNEKKEQTVFELRNRFGRNIVAPAALTRPPVKKEEEK